MEDDEQETILACYNLEITKKLKVSRCNEASDYVRKTPKHFHSMEDEDLSHRQQEANACASLQLQGQEQEEETRNISETTLVDVHLTINPCSQDENAPFICVTCKSYDKAIIGYPVQVTEVNYGSDTLLPCKNSSAHKEKSTSFGQLVWKTSRRTPVCYISNSLPCPDSKDVRSERAGEENSVQNTMIHPKNAGDFKGKGEMGNTCVPVELVFSKILSGLC